MAVSKEKVAAKDSANDEEPVVYTLDMPGVKHENLKVTLHNNSTIVIKATRKVGGNEKYYERMLRLQRTQLLDVTKLQAQLLLGVLTITVPKKDDLQPVLVPVAASYPPEVTESEDNNLAEFTLDLPGVKAADAKIEVSVEGIVTITAEHKNRSYNRMARFLQPVDRHSLKAYLIDGVLMVRGYMLHKSTATDLQEVIAVSTTEQPQIDTKMVESSKGEQDVVVEAKSNDADEVDGVVVDVNEEDDNN
eukprot:gb/GEZJ01004084.1/.p1 GENE.gb/GEZJ01004084.1/~~gb/GEZJ01004084.1/.p1  ORF type:complete len:286 (-),score=56.33 gb/GEZJ01004084.1/:71-814(-)